MRFTALLAMLLVAQPAERGQLEIRGLPAAEVIWEGVPIGETDAEGILPVAGIPPGDYSLTLRKPGYREASERITIAAGERLILRLPMIEIAAPPVEARAEAPAAGAPAAGMPATGTPAAGTPAEPGRAPIAVGALLALLLAIGILLRRRRAPVDEMKVDLEPPAFAEDLRHRERMIDLMGPVPRQDDYIEIQASESRRVGGGS